MSETKNKFTQTTAGPRQFSKVKKALGKLTWQRGAHIRVTGIEGQPETYHRSLMVSMFSSEVMNPRADELLQEVGDRFGWEITKGNANELARVLEEAAKEAEEAAPEVFNLRKLEQLQQQEERAAEQETKQAQLQAEARAAWQAVIDQRPPDAVALIVAQLDKDECDTMTDYFAHSTTRQVAIGWRTGQRESFKQLRKAAANFEPTAHMGPGCDIHTVEANKDPEDQAWRRGELLQEKSGELMKFRTDREARDFVNRGLANHPEAQPDYVGVCGFWHFAKREGFEVCAESVEHRDNYSGGGGNYLKAGGNHGSGWRVRSIAIPSNLEGHLSFAIEDGLPKAPAQSVAKTGEGYEISEQQNKRGTFWLLVMTDRVERAEFESLRASAKAFSGWYSRKWGKTPGGFGFKSEQHAQDWADATFGGPEVRCETASADAPEQTASADAPEQTASADTPQATLYDEAELAGLVTGSHRSDLYLKDTKESRALCKKYGQRFSCFSDARDGTPSLDCSFAFAPFWRERDPRKSKEEAPLDTSWKVEARGNDWGVSNGCGGWTKVGPVGGPRRNGRGTNFRDKAQEMADARNAKQEQRRAETASQDATPAEAAREREAQRLENLANTMQKTIDHKRAPLTQNPTPRRLAQKENQARDADALERTQEALRALAAAQRANALPPELEGLSSRKAVSDLLASWNPPHSKARQKATLLALVEKFGLSGDTRRAELKAQQEQTAELDAMRWQKIPGFFPTPPKAAERLVKLLRVQEGMAVLEPSGGTGSLVEEILENAPACQQIDVLEIMSKLANHMKAKFGHRPEVRVECSDFESLDEGEYDRIAMNPPFEKRQGIKHTHQAAQRLAEDGRLVSILPPNQAEEVSELLKTEGFLVWTEALPEGSFTGPDAFKQTGVSVCFLIVEKV